jgi:hypothetical protein
MAGIRLMRVAAYNIVNCCRIDATVHCMVIGESFGWLLRQQLEWTAAGLVSTWYDRTPGYLYVQCFEQGTVGLCYGHA